MKLTNKARNWFKIGILLIRTKARMSPKSNPKTMAIIVISRDDGIIFIIGKKASTNADQLKIFVKNMVQKSWKLYWPLIKRKGRAGKIIKAKSKTIPRIIFLFFSYFLFF